MPGAGEAIAELDKDVKVGQIRLHPRMHSWREYKRHSWAEELSDVPESELHASWQDDRPISDRYIASLLQYPLLEINLNLPAPLLQKADRSFADKNALVHRVLEAADCCLTVFRLAYCNFERLAYLPGRAGRLTDGSCAFYLIPSRSGFKADRHTRGSPGCTGRIRCMDALGKLCAQTKTATDTPNRFASARA